MPTYDYECDACGHTFEQFQNISEPHLTKCPKCKKPKLRRLIGAGAAVVFKGSGFYQTDYRSESYKKRAEAEKKSADGGSSTTVAFTGNCPSWFARAGSDRGWTPHRPTRHGWTPPWRGP